MNNTNHRKWLLSANLYSFSANYDSLRLVDKGYFCFMDEKITNTINKMLPPELDKAKELIDELLQIKPNERITNLEYLERNKNTKCPIDKNHHIKKNGHKNGTQRYWCYGCRKSFSITDKSITKSSKLTYHQFKTLLQCMYDYKPLTETALEVDISETSVFELEIKIFEALEKIHNSVILKGIVQADEKYISTSFKEFSKDEMPRTSRYNGKNDRVPGISNDQVCVVVAIDENDELIIKVVGNGPASTKMISAALENKIEPNSILVTDSKTSYIKFAEDNNLKLIQIPKESHKIGDYTLNDVNEIMTEISTYLICKRGISSRHLEHHMNFIRYRKILKYTVEYLEINESMFIDTIMLDINLKSNEVYSTNMPFDMDAYKDWYSNRNDK